MFERYTEKARRVIFFARYEASQFGSPFIETEHMLLGVVREDKALTDRFLRSSGAVESIRRQIEARTTLRQKVSTAEDLPLSHESKRVLAYAAEESDRLHQSQIGTAHQLLGLLREENSLAASILREWGLRIEQVRFEIARDLPSETDVRSMPEIPRERHFGGGAFPPGVGGWIIALQDAGRVLVVARHAAVQRHSACIETMDLLTALSIEKEFRDRFPGAAESFQARPKPSPAAQREKVSDEDLPFTEDCKQAFTLAAQEAAKLGQRTGPEHLVLGILGVESCAAAEVLRDCGLTAEGVRVLLTPPPPPSDPQEGRSYV